jgi:hypothetical protein
MLELIFKKADEGIISKRRMICFKCPSMQRNIIFGNLTCGTFLIPTKKTCGCDINEKTKIEKERCPKNKW